MMVRFNTFPKADSLLIIPESEIDCLTSALRNFIISHTTDVYENNYMTERVREDLARCRFKGFAGKNDPLYDILRDLSVQNDPGAPIDPTPEQKRSI